MVSESQATRSHECYASALAASTVHHHGAPVRAVHLNRGMLAHCREKFVTVEECATALAAAGLRPRTGGGVERGPAIGISSVGGGFAATGMVYSPFSGEWTLSDDTDVNYLLCASKP